MVETTVTQSLPAVIPFAFEGAPVRVVTRDGALWFVLADVCRVLEIANSRDAAGRLDDDEKDVVQTDTLGGLQNITVVSEAGLYRLILRSDKPQAKPFQKWVTGTVLPSIRKTGAYSIAPALDLNDPAALRSALLTYTEKVLSLQAEMAVLAPKAEAHDRLDCAAGDLTLTAAAKVLKAKPKKLIAYLSTHQWIYRRHDHAPWVGFQTKVDAGYLTHRMSSFSTPDGTDRAKEQVRVTPKGIAKLAAIREAAVTPNK